MERVGIQIIKKDVKFVKFLLNGMGFGVLAVDICCEHIHVIIGLEKNLIYSKIDIENKIMFDDWLVI